MKIGFSNVIGEKLKEMGRTQIWLAQETGLGKSAISDLMGQKADPSTLTAVKICKAMSRNIEELFFPVK